MVEKREGRGVRVGGEKGKVGGKRERRKGEKGKHSWKNSGKERKIGEIKKR